MWEDGTVYYFITSKSKPATNGQHQWASEWLCTTTCYSQSKRNLCTICNKSNLPDTINTCSCFPTEKSLIEKKKKK